MIAGKIEPAGLFFLLMRPGTFSVRCDSGPVLPKPSSLYTPLVYTSGDVCIPNPVKKPDNSTSEPEFNPDGTPVVRVRLPKKKLNEQFGLAELMMGANHIRVRGIDGVERMGRIKGKIKKRAWIREGDILIIVPWSFQDSKCDILYRYLPPQADWLRKNNYL